MPGATGIPIPDGGAKQPGDIGRVRLIGYVQVIIQIIASAVEKQADVHRLAARWRNPITGRQAQCILITSLQLALSKDILLNLFDAARQTSTEWKWLRIPNTGMFHFGHD
ncbi:hypothetical protein [Pseudomonas emilianonis]|uniref:hypothetical protein n=1 Tax=Pseudomonas emilianonis TaxID=2915812 RepID=UPI0031F5BA37